jgi:hypothetical protein
MTDLSCLVLSCTLKPTPAESSSELLGSQVLAAFGERGVVTAELAQALSDVGFTIPAQAATYWVGEAMQAVDYKDLDTTPETTAGTTEVLARNATHLAGLLARSPYPAG